MWWICGNIFHDQFLLCFLPLLCSVLAQVIASSQLFSNAVHEGMKMLAHIASMVTAHIPSEYHQGDKWKQLDEDCDIMHMLITSSQYSFDWFDFLCLWDIIKPVLGLNDVGKDMKMIMLQLGIIEVLGCIRRGLPEHWLLAPGGKYIYLKNLENNPWVNSEWEHVTESFFCTAKGFTCFLYN